MVSGFDFPLNLSIDDIDVVIFAASRGDLAKGALCSTSLLARWTSGLRTCGRNSARLGDSEGIELGNHM